MLSFEFSLAVPCGVHAHTGSRLCNELDLPSLYHKCLTLFWWTSLGDYVQGFLPFKNCDELRDV